MPAEPAHRPLPDFVGLGALKAGTSYLDAMLRSHPALSLPLHVKEVEFFNRHHNRGAAWYEKQFAADTGRPRGEVSPQYLHDAECAARIRDANAAAKLIVSVRDPIARAYSQYRHWVRETGYRSDFATFLDQHPGAVQRSRYFAALQPYRELFPEAQLHVVVFEDMVSKPEPVLREIYGFLGVDDAHLPAEVHTAVNSSDAVRFPRLYVRTKRVTRWLYAHGAGRTVGWLKGSAPAALLTRPGGTVDATVPIPAGLAARLKAEFRADTAQLSDYLGRDLLSLWRLNDS